jgi:hypothetical protein
MHLGRVEFNIVLLRTGRSLPAALHPCSRSRSCLQLRTDQCLCPIGTSTQLLVRTFRRTPQAPLGQIHPFDLLQMAKLQVRRDALLTVGKPSRLASGTPATQEVRRDALLTVGKPSRLARPAAAAVPRILHRRGSSFASLRLFRLVVFDNSAQVVIQLQSPLTVTECSRRSPAFSEGGSTNLMAG